ncbi:MFS transporter [Streptomyces uncialis]|uniref:MFS transporter n=1 Tax=Streptomyces uncialis TaxID=1048205 RepID=UPI0037943249
MTSGSNNTAGQRGTGWLICLLLTTFVIGTDDFVIAGVLPEIAADLHVGEAAAGQLVTVFSLTYALTAPPLAVATARLPRKPLIVGGLAVFAAANAVTAFAPDHTSLILLRIVTALIAATITPAVFAVAARAAAPERVGRAIGTVAAGLTVALFVGVPLGTLLSSAFGWRSTFVAVALFSTAVAVASWRLLPVLPGAPAIGVRRQLRILSRPAVLLCVTGTVLGASSGLMTYTYIAPLTRDITGSGGAVLALLISVIGVSGAAGTFLGGRLTDRWGADRALLATFGGLVAATAALAATGVLTDEAPVRLLAAVLAVWGFAAWGFNPPMNTRALQLARDAEAEAVALNTSGLYAGIAVAAAVGGWAVSAHGGTGVAVTATGIGLLAALVIACSVRRYPSGTAAAPGSGSDSGSGPGPRSGSEPEPDSGSTSGARPSSTPSR